MLTDDAVKFFGNKRNSRRRQVCHKHLCLAGGNEYLSDALLVLIA
ncbi:Uncharacterised protein [Serratia rubidaea]|uniref:Uncharacterized protein n=1 Tax=Serratia rubidaea TaxID=61652 RepID=A0A3S4FVM6_SERRU|nr:Uncharacterised protein [Serratia rubidaea]